VINSGVFMLLFVENANPKLFSQIAFIKLDMETYIKEFNDHLLLDKTAK
jgi:hypothetical protein